MNKVISIASAVAIVATLGIYSCTKEKPVTATETDGKAVRKIQAYTNCPVTQPFHGYFVPSPDCPCPNWNGGFWNGGNLNHGTWICGQPTGPCCMPGTQISTGIFRDLRDVVLFNKGTATDHFSKYTNEYIKGGLEADIVKLLITGEAKIAILGVDEKDEATVYCQITAPDYKLDIGLPITGK